MGHSNGTPTSGYWDDMWQANTTGEPASSYREDTWQANSGGTPTSGYREDTWQANTGGTPTSGYRPRWWQWMQKPDDSNTPQSSRQPPQSPPSVPAYTDGEGGQGTNIWDGDKR